jgi:hypothetical protein
MRRGGHFWWSVGLCAVAVLGAIRREGILSSLVAVAIGLVLILAWFPVWRVIATRSPEVATEGRPDLLGPQALEADLHPQEPHSNVRLTNGE